MDYFRAFQDLEPWQSPRGDAIDYLAEIAVGMKGGQTENSNIPAGYTYFAQFATHDITDMAGLWLGGPIDVARLKNRRTPLFDLDSVYGSSREEFPYLYETRARGRFLLGENAWGEPDLLRSSDRSGHRNPAHTDRLAFSPAIIPDQRNDQTIPIAQLHLAFQHFHNQQADLHGFREAQRLTRWHFQWLILNDLVPTMCGPYAIHADSMARRPNPRLLQRELPIEFVLAVFRIGHSMPRQEYELNELLPVKELISSERFRNYLNGGRVLPTGWSVQWDRFLHHRDSTPQSSMAMGPHFAPALYDLPLPRVRGFERWLPFRTLASGYWAGLPSGQSVARAMGLTPQHWHEREHDPLWHYVLLEAADAAGKHLGEMAGTLAADVLFSRIRLDPNSYLNVEPNWTPPHPDGWSNHREYDLAAFLYQAGAPMTRSDIEALRPQ